MEEKKTVIRDLNEAEQQEFDKQMDFLRREMERLQQGEHPQVKTYGCSCFSVLLIAMAIYLLFQLFR